MTKRLLILTACALVAVPAFAAAAPTDYTSNLNLGTGQTSTSLTQTSGAGQPCDGITKLCDSAAGYVCDSTTNTCILSDYSKAVDAKLSGVGNTAAASTCTPACSGNQTCISGTCVDSTQSITSGIQSGLGSGSSGAEFVPLAPIPGLTQKGIVTSGTLVSFLNNLYKYLIGIAVAIAIIEIIWGGLEYSMQDSVAKQTSGRHRIEQAIFGLVLILSPVLVFTIINPSILNLSVSLPPINVKNAQPANTATGGAGGDTTPAPSATGTYTIISDGTYFKKAIAADQAGADKFLSDKCGNLPVQDVGCAGSGLKDSTGCKSGTAVACGAELSGVTAYYWKYLCVWGMGCYGDHYVGVAPSYAQKVNDLVTGCHAEGGYVDESAKSSIVIPVYCTDTTGFEPYDSNKYSGYSCDYTDTFKCQLSPP